MDQTYYTYHIRITDLKTTRIEKRGPDNELQDELLGSFGFKGKMKTRIHALYHLARKGELVDLGVQELGQKLFASLFDEVVCRDFFKFYDEVRHKRALLRLELDIDERQLPEVAALPWEFMYVPSNLGYPTFWLGTATNLIFSRRRGHWNVPNPIQLAKNERLRIALVVAAPKELGPVKYEKIWEALQTLASTQDKRVKLLDLVNSATTTKIDDVLRQEPHIFHFIGHAQLRGEQQRDTGQIALADDILLDKPHWVGAERFGELFNRYQPGVVLLQACEGGMLSASEAFVGVASQVVQQNIPVVVAMQYEISNAMAQRFAVKFYERLAQNDPVDKAAQEGRRLISLGQGYTTRDFATPVLFMRVKDGRLFLPISDDEDIHKQAESRKIESEIHHKTAYEIEVPSISAIIDYQHNDSKHLIDLQILLDYKAEIRNIIQAMKPEVDLQKFDKEKVDTFIMLLKNFLKTIGILQDSPDINQFFSSAEVIQGKVRRALIELFVALHVLEKEATNPENAWRSF